MQKLITNSKGVTVIELIVVCALLSMVLLLIGSVHYSGQKQYTNHSALVNNQANVRLAVKVLEKDIRKNTAPIDDRDSTSTSPILIGSDTYEYSADQKAILKNSAPIANNIKSFSFKKTGTKISITVESIPNDYGKSASISTVIYVRQ